jgi:pyruvate kinase
MTKNKQANKPKALLAEITQLYDAVKQEGDEIFSYWKDSIHREDFKKSAENLSHYLALRNRDITELQRDLIPWGLSSLGRLESKTLVTIEAVLATLQDLVEEDVDYAYPKPEKFEDGRHRLQKNTETIFGKKPKNRETRIMVTMPQEAIEDEDFIYELVEAGMDVARINCAHNTQEDWLKIIENIQKASEKLEKDVRVLLDIAGPKIRTEWVYSHLSKPKVSEGDRIRITRNFDTLPAHDVNFTAGCSLDTIYEQVELEQPVLYDDGKVESVIEEVNEDDFILKVTKTKGSSKRIKAEKGMNFPKNTFTFGTLDEKDKADIEFACEHADIIGCSFVNEGRDIVMIQKEIEKHLGDKAETMSLMAKIETVRATRNLPEIIYTAASKNPFSVMIARGDLAAESGYIDLGAIQQEIMWLSEAADVPVVWATEVLDTLVSEGIPTRSEVTDAAEGTRADAIMLNKGDFIVDGVSTLNRIIERMEPLQYKKTPILGKLNFGNITND